MSIFMSSRILGSETTPTLMEGAIVSNNQQHQEDVADHETQENHVVDHQQEPPSMQERKRVTPAHKHMGRNIFKAPFMKGGLSDEAYIDILKLHLERMRRHCSDRPKSCGYYEGRDSCERCERNKSVAAFYEEAWLGTKSDDEAISDLANISD